MEASDDKKRQGLSTPRSALGVILKGHITFTDEVLETIRIRFIRFEARPETPTRREISERIERDVSTLHSFAAGASRSSSVAADLVATFPELADGITCPYCHQAMPGTTEHTAVTPIIGAPT